MNIDSVALYSPSKTGKTSTRKYILRCPKKIWLDLDEELDIHNDKTLLLPIRAPKRIRHKGTRPLCYLGIFKDAGLSKNERRAVKRIADFFADNVYDNLYLRRELDAQAAIKTIRAYASQSTKAGSVACNVVGRLHSAMAASGAYMCVLDGSTLVFEYYQKKYWGKPTMVSPLLTAVAPPLLRQLFHSHPYFQWLDLADTPVMAPIVEALLGGEEGPWTYLFVIVYSDGLPIACVILQFRKDEVILLEAATDLLQEALSILAVPAQFLYQRRTKKMIVDPIYRSRDTKCDDKLVFVIMPFTEKWSDRIWARIVRPLIESEGLEPKRADDLYGRDIMEDIWTSVLRSRFVVADVTGRNPNVFYELGLAHAIGKQVILLTQSVADIPFDLNRYRHIVYEDNLDGYDVLGNQLKASIREL